MSHKVTADISSSEHMPTDRWQEQSPSVNEESDDFTKILNNPAKESICKRDWRRYI